MTRLESVAWAVDRILTAGEREDAIRDEEGTREAGDMFLTEEENDERPGSN